MKTLKDLQELPNAAQPTGGQGIVLDLNGKLPVGISNGLLQLIVAGQHKIAFGSGGIHFSGGTQSDNPGYAAAHGLGVVPLAAFGCIVGMYGDCSIVSIDATNVTFIASSSQGVATGTVPVYWLAIA